jgi:hypothetical protein
MGAMNIHRLALLGVLVLVTSGCSAGASPSADTISHPTGPTDLVLRVSVSGGLIGPSVRLTGFPSLSLYGDGRLIMPGAQIEIYPGPAMPSLQVTRVTEAGMQRILRAARSAGLLGPDRHYDYQGIMDAGTTTFTVNAGGAIHRISAVALSEGQDLSRVPEDEREPRRLMAAFQQDLSDVRGRLGADVAGPDEPYVPTAIRIVAMKSDPKGADDPNMVKIVDWPLADLATFGEPRLSATVRCGDLTGADLEKVRAVLTSSHQLTFWRSGGRFYQFQLRPLLPDEQPGCPADA